MAGSSSERKPFQTRYVIRLRVQIWEQEFAWTEADKPMKLAARTLTVPDSDKLNGQPIFCFETMMHMLYWSCLVYDYQRVSHADF